MSNLLPKILASDEQSRYLPLIAFNKPCFESYLQLHTMLLSELGPRYAHYFSKPNVDSAQAKLFWTSAALGEVKAWEALNGTEKEQAEINLAAIGQGLRDYLLKLQSGQTGPSAASYANLLELAMKVPDDGQFLALVGGQPVVSFWGFETKARQSVDPSLRHVAHDVGQATSILPGAVNGVDPARAAALETTKKTGRYWLIGLLLCAAALVALLFSVRACSVTPAKAQTDAPAANAPQPSPPKPLPAVVSPAPAPVGLPDIPPTPEKLKRASQLVIPKGALGQGDLSFLLGIWELGSGEIYTYVESRDKPDIHYRPMMRFGESGLGTAFSADAHRKNQKQKRAVDNCTGAATTKVLGEKLLIDFDCVKSAEDGLRARMSLECMLDPLGKTACAWINGDGSRPNASLFRLE